MLVPKIANYSLTNNYCSNTKNNTYIQNNKNNIYKTDANSIDVLSRYNKSILKLNITFGNAVSSKKLITSDLISSYRVPNLRVVENCGLRGETLSSKKNRWFLNKLESLGVTDVVDLRDMYSSEKYPEMCYDAGIMYHNIPIDSFRIDTKKIIDKMPELFQILDNKNYYIACALGLHRTDIALAINYFFNPKAHEVPTMYGHQRNGHFKSDDIMRRIGSIKKELNKEDLKRLGWDKDIEMEFQKRKENFVKINSLLAAEAI